MNQIKKNILDLEYNKNLQYFNTTLILLSTYVLGIIVAILTSQNNYKASQITLIFMLTVLFVVAGTIFLIKFNSEMKRIRRRIKRLGKN